jgi:AcrR family transcriptional regulator
MAKKTTKRAKPRKSGGPLGSGREKLMASAMHLAATTRSLASLGLREVARHAGLNPNTFYRHFRDFDDLGLAVVEELSGELRKGLRERRLQPAAGGLRLSLDGDLANTLQLARSVIRESIALVLDSIAEHREAYVVGIREMHGTSPVLRKAMRKVLDDIANDMAEDVQGALRVDWLSPAEVQEISHLVIRQMTFFSLDYLEQPEQRDAIRAQAERFVLLLFLGALASRLAAASPAGLSGIRLNQSPPT